MSDSWTDWKPKQCVEIRENGRQCRIHVASFYPYGDHTRCGRHQPVRVPYSRYRALLKAERRLKILLAPNRPPLVKPKGLPSCPRCSGRHRRGSCPQPPTHLETGYAARM